MELTQEIIDYCEKRYKWDDDARQELYIKILEAPDDTVINKGWCQKVHNNMVNGDRRGEQRRAELRVDNYDTILNNLGLDGHEDDPAEITEGEQHILKQYNGMSPLLQETLIQYYVEGRTPEDIAGENWEDPGAVRKRITRARNQLKGETYE